MCTDVAVLKIALIVTTLVAFGCSAKDPVAPADLVDLETTLSQWQVIGEGSDFVTIMVPVPAAESDHYLLQGVVLDEARRPVRQISAIAWASIDAPIGHKWLSFVQFRPDPSAVGALVSSDIELTLHSRRDQSKQVYLFAYAKSWGVPDQPEIYDAPIPPRDISGVLQLYDYSFIASDDAQLPLGRTVAGFITGENGRWSRFTPTSIDIEGEEMAESALEYDRGWMELLDGKTYSAQAARAPMSPYVRGWWDAKGVFHPSDVIVQ